MLCDAIHCADHYTQLFGCEVSFTPFRYLGIPMSHHKLNNSDWNAVVQRFEKKLSGWKEKYMSSGGRLVLINYVLSSLPLFMMSFFEVPKEVLKRLDNIRSRFYWQGDETKRKYNGKVGFVVPTKDQGSLGITNLAIKNICLLSKWLFKLLNEDELWQQILCNKYLGSKSLTQVQYKPGDS